MSRQHHGRQPWLEPDPAVEGDKQGIDRTLVRENLKRTVAERMADSVAMQKFAEESRRAGRAAGHPKDLEVLAELEAIREETEGS